MNPTELYMLRHLVYWKYGLSLERFKEEVLYYAKKERKNKTKEEVKEKGLDIYEKKEQSLDKLLESCIGKDYVVISTKDKKPHVILTNKGREVIERTLTNDFCPEYEQFQRQVNQKLHEHGKPTLDPYWIMSSFYKNKTVNETTEPYLEWSYCEQEIEQYMMALLQSLGHTKDEIAESYIFNLTPKLFVPSISTGWRVTLEVKIGDQILKPPVTQPYPNKRYYVAGTKFENSNAAVGIFPIIEKKENFPEIMNIEMKWKFEHLTIIHHLCVHFKFGEEPGNLFCTEQNHMRTGTRHWEYHNIVIPIEPVDYQEIQLRERGLHYDEIDDDIVLFEEVTLTPIPIPLRQGEFADRNFIRFNERNQITIPN